MENHQREHADVAIVGAGMAGLFSAWRLLTHNPNLKIHLFDLLNRTGGRLDTDRVYIRDLDKDPSQEASVEVKDEEGGMRFNTSMQQLFTLLNELGLCSQVVHFGSGDQNNRFCVRGRSFTVSESAANNNALWKELYNLAPAEQDKSPTDIITAVYKDILSANNRLAPDNPTPEFWQEFRLRFSWKGIPLNEWGLWSLLRDFGLTEECIEMLTNTVGFAGPFLSNEVRAGEAYQILMDFPKDPQFFSLRQGFATLPDTLRDRLLALGAQIHLNSHVTSLSRNDQTLHLQVQSLADKTTRTVSAAKVILALPAKAMRDLYAASPALNAHPKSPALHANLGSVVGMRLCKVNLYYRDAWWHDTLSGQPPVSDGGNFTSLPMGSAYVFDPIVLSDAARNGPAALTMYCDFNNTNFWEQLQATGKPFWSPLQDTHTHADPQVLFAASEKVVEEATRQLKELFRTLYVPRPVLTSFRLWSGEHQFGAAYHQWVRFANDETVMGELANPVPDVYVCNEAWSDSQGWVNGSLRSAENVLTKHFGISPLVPDPGTWTVPCAIAQAGPASEPPHFRNKGGAAWLR